MDQMDNRNPWTYRGYLPHFDDRKRAQFITFRLYGSVPDHIIKAWQSSLCYEKDQTRAIIIHRRIERYLDQGHGECHLRKPQIAQLMQDSLLFLNNDENKVIAWVIMPNHVHLLLCPAGPMSVASFMKSLKSNTAYKANKLLNRKGKFWQEDYFDRYIRDREHFLRALRYIEKNPVKAGLCRAPEDWPYGSAGYLKRKEGF